MEGEEEEENSKKMISHVYVKVVHVPTDQLQFK